MSYFWSLELCRRKQIANRFPTSVTHSFITPQAVGERLGYHGKYETYLWTCNVSLIDASPKAPTLISSISTFFGTSQLDAEQAALNASRMNPQKITRELATKFDLAESAVGATGMFAGPSYMISNVVCVPAQK